MGKNALRLLPRIHRNIRSRLISGMLVLVPLGVTILVMRWLFGWVVSLLRPIVQAVLAVLARHTPMQSLPQSYVEALAILFSAIVLLLLLYIIGALGQFVVGKRLISGGETVMRKIPIARTIYEVAKQVIQAISQPNRAAFKSVVLVEFPRPGFKAIGFLTGYIKDTEGRSFSKIFIPTTPNPTSGFFEIVPSEDVIQTQISIEDAFKMIISGGIMSPEVLSSGKLSGNQPGTEYSVLDSERPQ